MSGVVTGSLERKEQLLEAVFGTMRSRQGSDCHVATSHVATSRLRVNNAEVNEWERRDVTTSRRHHVSSKICTSSFKVRMAQKLGYRETYERRHGFPEQSDTVFEEVPGTCTTFHFFWRFSDIRTMFSLLNIFIFSFIMF